MRVTERLVIDHVLTPRGMTTRDLLAYAAREGKSDLAIEKELKIPRSMMKRWKKETGWKVEVKREVHFTEPEPTSDSR